MKTAKTRRITGQCVDCGVQSIRSRCDKCREKARVNKILRESKYESQGLCVRGCGNKTQAGVKRCQTCTDKAKTNGKAVYQRTINKKICTVCRKPIEGRKSHFECLKDAALRSKYGISLEDYKAMYIKQNGKCALCDIQKVNLDVDHDHQTGSVRQLLCSRCNMLIGYIETSTHLIDSAFAYIQKHKTQLE